MGFHDLITAAPYAEDSWANGRKLRVMTRVVMILSLLPLVQRILAPMGVDNLRVFKMARGIVIFFFKFCV